MMPYIPDGFFETLMVLAGIGLVSIVGALIWVVVILVT